MTIKKISSSLPTSTKIENLNDMIIELDGKIESGKFDANEIQELYSGTGLDRKFLRDQPVGNTLSTYTGWSHLHAQSGYSIWEIAPTNYTYNSLNKLYFDDKILVNMGQAASESTSTFSYVYVFDGSYHNYTTEAGTEGGTEFALFDTTSEYLYLGSNATFTGFAIEFETRGSNYDIELQLYHSGAGWTGLTSNIDNLVDDTSDFLSDGRISWDLNGSGSGWGLATINANTAYWARLKTNTTPVTVAEAYSIIPSDNVITLLTLSSTEFEDETWKWCSYGSNIYATIRNTGNSAYEGDYYISSASTTKNKQNFFIYNHEYKADYQDSTYSASGSGAFAGKLGIGMSEAIARLQVREASLGNEVLRLETLSSGDYPTFKTYQSRVATTSTTGTVLQTFPLTDNNVYLFEGRVVARSATLSGASFIRKAAYKRSSAGNATKIGSSTDDFTARDATAWQCAFDTSTSNVRLVVTGAGSTNITWHSTVLVQNLSS